MLGRVTKNTTGIDLKHLFIGSEGTMGVITRLVLKFAPLPGATNTALCALPSFEAAIRLVHELRRALPGLSAFEVMWVNLMDAALAVGQLRLPFDKPAPVYALVELQGQNEGEDRARLEAVLGNALEHGTVSDVVVAQSLEDANRLWAYREAIGEMLGQTQPYAAFDIGIPMAEMAGFVGAVREAGAPTPVCATAAPIFSGTSGT
ncbi:MULTISPECIES: FAD-binding oxidoreductase [Hydrogenophaga]|uniref:FAD-binding oxidoreductase n=2 Tax=Hydrogenophaga TaxID=47420 RepID=A0ABW2QNB3_9BURK